MALTMAAAGVAPVVAPVKKAGNQSEGRGTVRVPSNQGTGGWGCGVVVGGQASGGQG